jgi:hypothetical protein
MLVGPALLAMGRSTADAIVRRRRRDGDPSVLVLIRLAGMVRLLAATSSGGRRSEQLSTRRSMTR